MAIAASRGNDVRAIRPVSVSNGIYDAIYERLMSLEIAPGARIPIDALARELGISQTPVREALTRLEREGLVRKLHLVGYSAAPQLTRRQFDDLYAFRMLLEPEGARLAARNMTPEALATIVASAVEMDDGPAPAGRNSRYSRFARADGLFHDAILRVGGNEVIRHALADQHVHLHIFRLMFHVRVTEEALEEHEAVLAALRAGDPDAAAEAMRLHIERSRDRLLPAFE